jgi:hypothetical protein
MPLIFTAVGRVKENLRTPSRRAWLHQRAWPASELRMKSAIDGGTIQPASGSYTAGKPSRFVSGGCATGETKTGQSCHGLCWSSLRRVGCFFTARRGAPSSSACARSAVRRGPLSVGRHPLVGFASDYRSGDVHSFDPRRVPRAQGAPGTGTRSCIEVRRRHPCRRRPFSVLERSAPSRSERFQAVASVC